MLLQVENGLIHEDVEFQSELRHTLDVLIDEHGNVEMRSLVHCGLCRGRGV